MSLKWFLYDIFSSLDRGFLLESKSREQMVHYFNTIIEQFRDTEMESSSKEECKLVSTSFIILHVVHTKEVNNRAPSSSPLFQCTLKL